MTFIGWLERFGTVDTTQAIVRGWLAAGALPDRPPPYVAIAVADEQTAGRGRLGRAWSAPSGVALLLSIGCRPEALELTHGWRLGATVALAMIDALEAQGLREGTIGLKWPNDLVADGPGGRLRKLAGLLGELEADAGGRLASAVVGIGVNVDWPADRFPPALASAMTSLRELLHRQADRDALLDDFLARLEPRYLELLAGRFDAAAWTGRQRTTGRELEILAGEETVRGRGLGVDPDSGALLVATDAGSRALGSGEVVRCRLALHPAARSA